MPELGFTTGDENRPSRFSPWMVLPLYVLFCLVIAVGTWLFPALLEGEMMQVVLLAAMFSFASLLGIWVSLGSGALRRRLAWAFGGVCYCPAVCVFLDLLTEDRIASAVFACVIFSLPAIGIAVVLSVIQRLGFKLTVTEGIGLDQHREGFQFSLRSLMGFILAVAVLLAIGRSNRVYEINSNFEIIFAAAIVVLLIYVALAGVWATLGQRQPLLPTTGVVLVAASLGVAVGSFDQPPLPVRWAAFAATEAAGIVGPLLLVRRRGYRLFRLPEDRLGKEGGACELG